MGDGISKRASPATNSGNSRTSSRNNSSKYQRQTVNSHTNSHQQQPTLGAPRRQRGSNIAKAAAHASTSDNNDKKGRQKIPPRSPDSITKGSTARQHQQQNRQNKKHHLKHTKHTKHRQRRVADNLHKKTNSSPLCGPRHGASATRSSRCR